MTEPLIIAVVLVCVLALVLAIGYHWGYYVSQARNMRRLNNILNRIKTKE